MTKKSVRVAAAQFHVGADIDENLNNCLRILGKAAECQPDIILLPEFCNHLSWYNDKQHCFDVSVRIEGAFLNSIAEKAQQLGCYVVVNCTVQRDDGSATGSSLLYSPEGTLLIDNTKQIYIGHENDFLEKAKTPGAVVDTPIGRLGLYACMDGVINETPRCLALNGAQIILNSLNSFATDEGSLHVPVRAAENKVFVVGANKVGPLVPAELLDGISAATGIPPRFLNGAGESQVVAPDGAVLALASVDQEEIVFADLDLSAANDKKRPDGTDVFAARRPELYKAIAQDPANQPMPIMHGSAELSVAVVQLESIDLSEAVAKAAEAIEQGVALVALPPLLGDVDDVAKAADQSQQMISSLAATCGASYVTTAAVLPCEMGFQYCSIVIGDNGLVLSQPQLHKSERFAWSYACDEIFTADLPFGRIGLASSDDSIYPEYFRLLAMAGVEMATVPLVPLEAWELRTGLVERAAENRINLLVAAQPSELGTSISAALQTDFTVMTEWRERAFDGLLSQPILQRMPDQAGIFLTTLYPVNAANKVVSNNTDLLANRPWELSEAIVRKHA